MKTTSCFLLGVFPSVDSQSGCRWSTLIDIDIPHSDLLPADVVLCQAHRRHIQTIGSPCGHSDDPRRCHSPRRRCQRRRHQFIDAGHQRIEHLCPGSESRQLHAFNRSFSFIASY